MKKPGSHQVASFAGCFILVVTTISDLFYFLGFSGLLGRHRLSREGMLIFMLIQVSAIYIGNVRKINDVQEAQRSAEERNEALARMSRLKTEFLGNVSHELRTPLTVISSYAQSAGIRLSREEDFRPLAAQMKIISSEAERLSLMVGQMLDITRIEEGHMDWNMQTISIEKLISDTMQTYYPVLNKNHNRLVLKIDERLPVIKADSVRISQVLVNLLSNAIRHTRRGEITVSAYLEGNLLSVCVADTGEGIASDQLPMLFDRYYHNKTHAASSTGLGLYISKYIIEAHGGNIYAASTLGKGTSMHFTLPLHI